jgi:hypothetical protein
MKALELDHVLGGGLQKKGPSTMGNLVTLSGASCHPWKTENGRTARPLLLAYLEAVS